MGLRVGINLDGVLIHDGLACAAWLRQAWAQVA